MISPMVEKVARAILEVFIAAVGKNHVKSYSELDDDELGILTKAAIAAILAMREPGMLAHEDKAQ